MHRAECEWFVVAVKRPCFFCPAWRFHTILLWTLMRTILNVQVSYPHPSPPPNTDTETYTHYFASGSRKHSHAQPKQSPACLSYLPCCRSHIPPFRFFPDFFPPFLLLTNMHRHTHAFEHARTHTLLGGLSLCCWKYFRLADTEKNNTNLYVWNGLLCSSLHIADVPAVTACVCEDNTGIFCTKCSVTSQCGHIHRFILADAFASMRTFGSPGSGNKQKNGSKNNPRVCVCVLQGSKVWWRPIKIASLRSSCTGPPTSLQSFRKWPPLPQRKCTPKKPWWERERERWREKTNSFGLDIVVCWCLHWHRWREAKDK